MSKEWFVVEWISVLVENFAFIYFLNSRYHSKYNSYWPEFGTWIILIICGTIASMPILVIYAVVVHSIMFVYLIIFKHGTLLHKFFSVLIVCSIGIGTSIVGAGLASAVGSTTIEHTLTYQDTTRMLAIIFIKMMQVTVFYVLAKKHVKSHNLKKGPAFVLSGVAIVVFVFLFMIRMYVESPDLNPQQNHLLVWLAIGALFAMIAIFIIYELFIREEIKNVELAMKLQRFELESCFYKEIENIYSDMRVWQHEYKNNLCSLQALVDNGEKEKALNFITNMYGEVYKKQVVLQTGNLVLDAIVSSKLWLAQSKNIKVNIRAVYPENNCISDNDLCAIAGNLIDNAIEACVRMGGTTENRFIDFLLMIKGKNLLLTIRNSCNNELKRKGNRYLTVKSEPFHGIGILHVDSIVEKYQGHVLRSQEDGVFETNVMLPLFSLDETYDE